MTPVRNEVFRYDFAHFRAIFRVNIFVISRNNRVSSIIFQYITPKWCQIGSTSMTIRPEKLRSASNASTAAFRRRFRKASEASLRKLMRTCRMNSSATLSTGGAQGPVITGAAPVPALSAACPEANSRRSAEARARAFREVVSGSFPRTVRHTMRTKGG